MAGLIPPGLQIPPGMSRIEFYLQLPAMASDKVPAGADRTMMTNAPEQVWFLVVAVTCTAIPALFLSLRVYTRLAIVGSFELADCKFYANAGFEQMLTLSDFLFLAFVRFLLIRDKQS
jgi:hypothetical protein